VVGKRGGCVQERQTIAEHITRLVSPTPGVQFWLLFSSGWVAYRDFARPEKFVSGLGHSLRTRVSVGIFGAASKGSTTRGKVPDELRVVSRRRCHQRSEGSVLLCNTEEVPNAGAVSTARILALLIQPERVFELGSIPATDFSKD
jgi:hypothetical protein